MATKWNPKTDPVVRQVHTPDGEIVAQTKSGRYIAPQVGVYINNYTPPKGSTVSGGPKSAPTKPTPAAGPGNDGVTAASTDAVGLLTHGKGSQTVTTPTGPQTINVRGLQVMLKKQGYDIATDGKLGPQTISALRDYYKPGEYHNLSSPLQKLLAQAPAKGSYAGVAGKDNPKAWNTYYGTPATRSTAVNPPTGRGANLNPQGYQTTPTADPTQTAPPAQTFTLPKSLVGSTSIGTPLSAKLAQFGNLTPMSAADAIAGEQFDPQIREAQLALSHDPLQRQQNQKDISAWYDQVEKAQGHAAANDASQNTAAVGGLGDAAAQLVASLGGSANTGAGVVGAEGQNDVGTLAALGQAENDYQNDVAPLLKAEGAGQLTNQNNKDLAQQQSDQVGLENLQGQRGQALTAAQAQIRDANNGLLGQRAQMALNVGQDNNQLAQQGFTNQLSLAQARLAAMMDGLQVQGQQAKTAVLTQQAHSAAWARNHPFLASSPGDLSKLASTAAAGLYDPQGNRLNLKPQQAWARVASVYRGAGMNPVPGTPSYAAAHSVVNAWQNGG